MINPSFSINEIFMIIDHLPPLSKRSFVLPGINVRVAVNNKKSMSFNRLYNRSKTEELKCCCCGKTPTHVEYRENAGLRMIVKDSVDNFLTFDHVIPKSLGGSTTDANLAIMCFQCNIIKSNTFKMNSVKLVYNLNTIFNQLAIRYKSNRSKFNALYRELKQEFQHNLIDELTFINKIFSRIKQIKHSIELSFFKLEPAS